MEWTDGHLDLAYLAECGRDMTREMPVGFHDGCVTLPALRRAEITHVFATIFTEPGALDASKPHMYAPGDPNSAEVAGLRQVAIYERWERDDEIVIDRTLTTPSYSSNDKRRIKCTILMEGADPIRSPEDLPKWKDRGVRIVGLTWAMGSRYAGGNTSEFGSGSLTSLGVEMIRSLDDAGIIHDVSHLSDAAFDGLMEHARGQIIASHSNCRVLVDNKQRHLRDGQIKTLAKRNAVIGLNLHSPFLAVGRRATLDDCIAHIEHVVELMGHRKGIALGSDMDGGFGPDKLPAEIDHPTKLQRLADALSQRDWTDEDIRGFAHENWGRVL